VPLFRKAPAGQNPAGAFEDRTYGRDVVGNRVWMQNAVKADFSEWYDYDSLDRLIDFKRGTLNGEKTDVSSYTSDTHVTQRQEWTDLSWVGNWNASAITKAGVTTTDARTHNDANEILSRDLSTNGQASGSPIAFPHDDNGNMANDGQFLYDYDAENRITRARRVLPGSPPQVVVVGEYYYDAIGRRVRKVVSNCGSSRDGDYWWLWDQNWQLVQVRRINGTSEAIEKDLIASGDADDCDDYLAYLDATANIFFIHSDYMQSPAALSDAAAGVVERTVSDPYGRSTYFDGSLSIAGTMSAFANVIAHQGLVGDDEVQKVYNRSRERDGLLGRFVQRDAAEYDDFVNLYAYVENGPCDHFDPSGNGKLGAVVKGLRKGYKYFVRTAAGGWRATERKRAIRALAKDGDAIVSGEAKARRVSRAAHPGEEIVRHDGHILKDGERGLPHYQPKNGGGHAFYPPLVGIGAWLFGEDTVMADAVDFINPLSDVQDGLDLIAAIIDFVDPPYTGGSGPGQAEDPSGFTDCNGHGCPGDDHDSSGSGRVLGARH